MSDTRCGRIAAALAALLISSAARAETPPTRPSGIWGLNGTFGTGGTGGGFSSTLRKPVSWDYNFFREYGSWRVGIGYSFASFGMKTPHENELEWGWQQGYLFGTRMFNNQARVRPYIQVRAGITRLRPRSDLFKMNPLPPDWVSGEATKAKTDGFGFGIIPGVEFKISRAAHIDTSLSWDNFHVSEYDLSPVGQPPASSGSAWQARLGITWFPNGEEYGEGPTDSGKRDAWGVKQSYGWAAGEVIAINNGGGIAAQWIRNVDWSETSPRSWWTNLKHGFEYDPDQFKTNQWTHPFNGAAYYNSARSHGISFFPSAAIAAVGATQWEMAGETQPMSFNDMFSTILGGIALGEAQYRLSSEILNNQATGWHRFIKELGGFVVDPVRGFNRLISGDAKAVKDNPKDPIDWRPENAQTFFALGARTLGEESLSTNTQTNAMALINYNYGNVFDNPRRKPFDYMEFIGELNMGGTNSGLERAQIRGDIASWALGQGPTRHHIIAIVQYYDYVNSPTYTFGAQSLGAAFSSRFGLSDRIQLLTRVDANGILLGAINSEYAYLADIPHPERLREYDYGPGFGAQARAEIVYHRKHLLMATYRLAYIAATNGSVYQKNETGLDATHTIQNATARLVIPVKGFLGLGADFAYFTRDSAYTVTHNPTGRDVVQHVHQHAPQLRVYFAVDH
jgi:hypothetical protein